MKPIDGTQLPAAHDQDGLTGAYAPTDPEQARRARLYVCEQATDAADAGVLLAMLGLGGAA